MRLSNAKSLASLAVRLALASLAVVSSGCVYRMTIQQGNFLEKRAIDQLQVGMTRSQVRYLLGTPMVPATFDNDRWDYLYYMKRGRIHKAEERQLTVYFQNDKVERIDNYGQRPMDSEPAQTERPLRPAT
jgi:outer membrane protein assembly factor BamE